jgi:rubrerythrin
MLTLKENMEERLSVYIQQAITQEQQSIDFYIMIMEHPELTDEQRIIIDEILKTKQDHLTRLTSVMSQQIELEFPQAGE